jgi:hypothetical protein
MIMLLPSKVSRPGRGVGTSWDCCGYDELNDNHPHHLRRSNRKVGTVGCNGAYRGQFENSKMRPRTHNHYSHSNCC